MAILENGPNGGFSGKLGSVVGYSYNGKSYIRSLPKAKKRKSKPTAKQAQSRNNFATVQRFLSPLLPFIRVGYNIESRLRLISAHNLAKSTLMRHALDLNGALDYSKVTLAVGNLLGFADPQVSTDSMGFHFTWANNQSTLGAGYNDQIMLAAYDEHHHVASFLLSGARRKDGHELLSGDQLVKNQQYHLWMAFIADDRLRISNSIYMGCFVF